MSGLAGGDYEQETAGKERESDTSSDARARTVGIRANVRRRPTRPWPTRHCLRQL